MRRDTIRGRIEALEKIVSPRATEFKSLVVERAGDLYYVEGDPAAICYTRAELDKIRHAHSGMMLVIVEDGSSTIVYPSGQSRSVGIDVGKL